MRQKLYVGPKIRVLREGRGWRLDACARQLGVSVSYLSQIESNQRPVSSRVLMALVETFGVPADLFEVGDDQRLISDLREAVAESGSADERIALSELKQVALQAPAFARRFLDLHRANHRLAERLNLADEAVSLDEATAASSLLPYEEVRDFFHYKDNYLDALDRAAEALADEIGFGPGLAPEPILRAYLADRMAVEVRLDAAGEMMRRFDRAAGVLSVNPAQPATTRAFQLAFHIASVALRDLIETELVGARFKSREAQDVCRIGLGNYAAGALLLPYGKFAAAARERRHDVEQLALMFGASLEQVCHRLSTLQRPGRHGVPFYFVRLDNAGNITKRHSATRFRFARFGGACPLWNVHDAVSAPDRFHVQVAEMPDGVRYLCVARSILKPSESYLVPDRRYVLGFGCEIAHAQELVYAQGVDLKGPAAAIGVSCRICERDTCAQRAFPPVDRPLRVPTDERRVVPFRL